MRVGKVTIKLVEYDTSKKIYGRALGAIIHPVKKQIIIEIEGLFIKSKEVVKEIEEKLNLT